MSAWVTPDPVAPRRGVAMVTALLFVSTVSPPVKDGAPATALLSIAPKIVFVTVMGLQTGGPYASLTREQYESLVDELLKAPAVRRRAES
jgi:hypothetical protein